MKCELIFFEAFHRIIHGFVEATSLEMATRRFLDVKILNHHCVKVCLNRIRRFCFWCGMPQMSWQISGNDGVFYMSFEDWSAWCLASY